MAPGFSALLASPTVDSLARALGSSCLASETQLRQALADDPAVDRPLRVAETAVYEIGAASWEAAEDAGSGFQALVSGTKAEEELRRLSARGSSLSHLALLRGLCRGVLTERYRSEGITRELQPGDPLPLARRSRPRGFTDLTPAASTVNGADLLQPVDFTIFPKAPHGLKCVLDFSLADDLDEATWREQDTAGSFSQLAGVHPMATSAELMIMRRGPGRFFVEPRDWDAGAVLQQLQHARGHGAVCAVLPELTLPDPKALEPEIRTNRQQLPPLVVGGSAHTHRSDNPYRADNEGWVYLHGARLIRYRKIRPFRTKHLPPDPPSDQEWAEDISREPKSIYVACGRHTRLAVVICADLNDAAIQQLLVSLGVNLLLVPALTPSEGAFVAGLSAIASLRQGVALVANGAAAPHPTRRPRRPFQAMVAAPHSSANRQLQQFGARWSGRRGTGVFDLHVPLRRALSWHPFPHRGWRRRAGRGLLDYLLGKRD